SKNNSAPASTWDDQPGAAANAAAAADAAAASDAAAAAALDAAAAASAAAAESSATQGDLETVTPGNDSNDTTSASKPASGFGTLSIAELRFCIAEDIRIAAQNQEMESTRFIDVDRFNRNVDSFNQAVNDYNSRCSHRQILARDRPVATSQVEVRRTALESE